MLFQLTGREKSRLTSMTRGRVASSLPDPPHRGYERETKPTVAEQEAHPAEGTISTRSHGEPESPDSPNSEEHAVKPFKDCDQYEDRGGCRTVLHQRYGGNRGDILRCTTCGRTFSTHRGKLTFRSRLSPEKLNRLMESHKNGESIRKTAKNLGLNRGTVRRYYRLMEEGAALEPEDSSFDPTG